MKVAPRRSTAVHRGVLRRRRRGLPDDSHPPPRVLPVRPASLDITDSCQKVSGLLAGGIHRLGCRETTPGHSTRASTAWMPRKHARSFHATHAIPRDPRDHANPGRDPHPRDSTRPHESRRSTRSHSARLTDEPTHSAAAGEVGATYRGREPITAHVTAAAGCPRTGLPPDPTLL
jgi:hypothetical protein